jgi:hypothetical protein
VFITESLKTFDFKLFVAYLFIFAWHQDYRLNVRWDNKIDVGGGREHIDKLEFIILTVTWHRFHSQQIIRIGHQRSRKAEELNSALIANWNNVLQAAYGCFFISIPH